MADEQKSKEHHGRDYGLGGLGLLAEFFAVKFGINALAWVAAALFWLALYSYTKHRIASWKPIYRWSSRLVAALIFAAVTVLLIFLPEHGNTHGEKPSATENKATENQATRNEQADHPNSTVSQGTITPEHLQNGDIQKTSNKPKKHTASIQARMRQQQNNSSGVNIQQSSTGANSPNVVGSGNQFNYAAEPFTRILMPEQIAAFKQNLSSVKPIRFWLTVDSGYRSESGFIEAQDEQGVFANQLESVFVSLGWTDVGKICDTTTDPATMCPECAKGLYCYKYGNPTTHGMIIMAPTELMDSAKRLSAEFQRLMFRHYIKQVDRYREDKPDRLNMIIIEVGTN